MRTSDGIVPHGGSGDTERMVYGRSHVLRRLRIRSGIAAHLVGRTDDGAATDATAVEEHRLHRSPMVAARQLVVLRQRGDLGRPAKLARHDDQRALQLTAPM